MLTVTDKIISDQSTMEWLKQTRLRMIREAGWHSEESIVNGLWWVHECGYRIKYLPDTMVCLQCGGRYTHKPAAAAERARQEQQKKLV